MWIEQPSFDDDLVKYENPEYKNWKVADGTKVGDSPDKKLDSPDWNKDDSKKSLEKIYTAQPSSIEKSQQARDKNEAMQLAANPDNDSWPPITIESHVGWTEWWKNLETKNA